MIISDRFVNIFVPFKKPLPRIMERSVFNLLWGQPLNFYCVWFLETKLNWLKEDKYRLRNKTEFVMNTKLFYWFLC